MYQEYLAMDGPGLQVSEEDVIAAKSFLLSSTTTYGGNLYDHLASVLKDVLAKRIADSGEIFEKLSEVTKNEKFTSDLSTVREYSDTSLEVALATIQKELFTKGQTDDEDDVAEGDNLPIPNLMELEQFFEASGIGLNREEMFRIALALKTLCATYPLANVRFWGKIYGTEQNYNIAEVEFEEGQGEMDEDENETNEEQLKEEAVDDAEEANFETGAPKPKWQPPPEVPIEGFGEGANKYVYFVCTEPGRPWIRLPRATPAHIANSRRIRKFFSGNLDKRIVTYPPFNGQEKHYLRSQIARISASTVVSPVGFFQFDDEEEPEEGEGQDNYTLNVDFEGLGLPELIDPGLDSWVHHVRFLLPQGRCTWWNPKSLNEEMEEGAEEEEEGALPETGMPLLSPLAEDRKVDKRSPWSPHISSKQIGQFAFAYISSNLWPGAHAFSAGRIFGNIYIGWGAKYSAQNFNPFPHPKVMNEYEWGPEILEVEDPTPEEEAALRALLEAKPGGGEEGAGEGEGEGEEDKEAEDEDEDED